MANTFSCVNIHWVFSTKERVPVPNPNVRERLWPYMGGIAKQNGIFPKSIGGVADHVHLLLGATYDNGHCKSHPIHKGGIFRLGTSDLSRFAKLCLAARLWRFQHASLRSRRRSITSNSSSNTIGPEHLKRIPSFSEETRRRYRRKIPLGLAAPSYRTLTERLAYGTFPGTSCQATFSKSLRDRPQSAAPNAKR